MYSLLNILKAYYANVHQDKPRPTNTDGTDRLQLSRESCSLSVSSVATLRRVAERHRFALCLDTRQTLGKSPTYEDQNHVETHSYTSPAKKSAVRRAPQPHGSVYLSIIPQVDYTDGPTPTNPTKLPRTLLEIPTHKGIPPILRTHPIKRSSPELTVHPPHTTTRAVCSPKKARPEGKQEHVTIWDNTTVL